MKHVLSHLLVCLVSVGLTLLAVRFVVPAKPGGLPFRDEVWNGFQYAPRVVYVVHWSNGESIRIRLKSLEAPRAGWVSVEYLNSRGETAGSGWINIEQAVRLTVWSPAGTVGDR